VNGIHDLGGMDGFGPVAAEKDEPVFHFRWEGIVRAMMQRTVGRYYHLDEFRHAIERMPPAEYLEAGYYERWLHAVETALLEKGVVTAAELRDGRSAGPAPAPAVRRDPPPVLQARFRPGDRVRTRNLNPKGHTRLPRYARGKRGTIRTVNGPFLLPDANAHGPDGPWQPCYAVEFSAAELWGEGANPADRVCVDLWESYLQEDQP
jgi:nitrile hydratase subunit beta